MSTHEEVLARVTLPWLDIVPSRRSMPKRALPRHADEPSPNVVVCARSTDKTTLAVCGEFRLRHRKPGFDSAHVPQGYAWQFMTPDGRRLMLFTWVNWKRNSKKLFEEFCRETGREFGELSHDGTVSLGGRTIAFSDCRPVHESELRPRAPLQVKGLSAEEIAERSERLLKCRKSRSEELHCREFFDDVEAHDEELQRQLEECFRATLTGYETALSSKYGHPTEAGAGEHRDIPFNGVVRHVIWPVGKRRVYLALSHEDRELPWVLSMGVKV